MKRRRKQKGQARQDHCWKVFIGGSKERVDELDKKIISKVSGGQEISKEGVKREMGRKE